MSDDVHVRKVVAFLPVSAEMLEEAELGRAAHARILDRWRRPWAYADQPALRGIVVFPRWDRLGLAGREARRRLGNAWVCLRYGVSLEDE